VLTGRPSNTWLDIGSYAGISARQADNFLRASPPPSEICPVCTTPLGQTVAGDAAAIRAHVAQHLEELADYAKAKGAG
jgi:hypothetical protein